MAPKRCAVCKVLKEDCVPGCITAPHFPSGDTRFEDVHEIFGAANVRMLLNGLGSVEEREIAANSLCYAAEARKRDPISGVYGMIQHNKSILKDVERQVKSAQNELGSIVGDDQVPNFFDLPMPADFLTTTSVESYTEIIKNLSAATKNQIMQNYQKVCDGHGADGASTSAGPSTRADGASTSAGPSTKMGDGDGDGAGPSTALTLGRTHQ